MTEEEMYTIKDIKKLSLLEDTKVDLIDKNIDASDEIAGVVLLPHGMKADSKPFNDNFIYLSARMDNIINNQQTCKNAIEEYKGYVDVARQECITVHKYGSPICRYRYTSNASNDAYVLLNNVTTNNSVIYLNTQNHYWVKHIYSINAPGTSSYAYETNVTNSTAAYKPWQVECGGMFHIKYSTSTSSAKAFTVVLPNDIKYLHTGEYNIKEIIFDYELYSPGFINPSDEGSGLNRGVFGNVYVDDDGNVSFNINKVSTAGTYSACVVWKAIATNLNYIGNLFNSNATFYAHVNGNGEIHSMDTRAIATGYTNISVTRTIYENYLRYGSTYYIYQDGQIIVNPDYEGES